MLRSMLVDDVDAFYRLKDAWDDLARSVSGSRYSQTFEWAKTGWETRDAADADRLICATVWSDDRLVGIWPFQLNRLGSATRLEPMGCGLHEEFGDPLFAADVSETLVCEALLRMVRPLADVIDVPFVRDDGPMHGLLSKAGLFTVDTPFDSFVLEKRDTPSFEALLQSHSANFRANLKQKRKRLQKLGDLRFELLEDEQTCAETLDWMLAEKRKWLLRHDKESPWLQKEEARAFFMAAASMRSEFGRVGFFRLTLDGKPIAAFLTTIDRTRIEMFVTVFAPDYGRYSPGILIIENVVRWGFERGLDFDMRVLRTDYKERWANAFGVRIGHRVPLTWRGVMVLLPNRLELSLRRFLHLLTNAEQRAALRRALKWRPSLARRQGSEIAQMGLRAAQED